jgi:hypothetical protein
LASRNDRIGCGRARGLATFSDGRGAAACRLFVFSDQAVSTWVASSFGKFPSIRNLYPFKIPIWKKTCTTLDRPDGEAAVVHSEMEKKLSSDVITLVIYPIKHGSG